MDQLRLNHTNIKIVYYTHPLCPVSWRMQKDWQQFISVFGQFLSFRFCMSAPALNVPDVSLDNNTKLPATNACQAVKAASLQSQWAADTFLDALRKAAMQDERDVSQMDVLVEIAREISRNHRQIFDLQRFGMDLNSRYTRRAIQDDLLKIRINKVDRFPTITFTVDGKGIKVTGYNSFDQLASIFRKLSAQSNKDSRSPVY
ncbi:DsbA family protein [Dyadobacter sp. 676]|uniref:DsbA family protein n=1 Tax=Dyadobacter sp. 676 TaxID=3088362 RepID=A0AAU8FLN1_9BACT